MKFTNGYWMIRDGVSALYAREAYELGIGEDGESLNILGTDNGDSRTLRYVESTYVRH